MKLRKSLGIFLAVLLLNCSCYANKVDVKCNCVTTNVTWLRTNKNSVDKNGINRNGADKNGNTILHLAVMSKKHANVETIKNLIENGADVNAKNNSGYTPLEYVIFDIDNCGDNFSKKVQFELTMLFLNNGARVNARSLRGKKIRKRIIQIICNATNKDVTDFYYLIDRKT